MALTVDRGKQAEARRWRAESAPGDHSSHVPESIRRSVEFFKRFGQEAAVEAEPAQADMKIPEAAAEAESKDAESKDRELRP